MRCNRRSDLSFYVTMQRGADYTERAASSRGMWLLLIIVAMLAGGTRWWGWVPVIIGTVGTALSLATAFHESRNLLPRLPIIRWAIGQTISSKGTQRPNISGLIEALAVLPLGVVGAWSMNGAPVVWRWCAVAAAAGWAWSFVCAVFLEPAFYNPDVRFWRFIEVVRSTCGFITAALAAALIVPAPWPGESRWVALGICLLLIGLQVRIRETDRGFILAEQRAMQRQLEGRTEITDALHGTVGTPLDQLVLMIEEIHEQYPELYDGVRQVSGGFREVLELDHGLDVTIDWPGVLIGNLQAMLGRRGIAMPVPQFPAEPMHEEDRKIARIVLQDMASNVVRCGAFNCAVALVKDGAYYCADVSDDGSPIDQAAWMRPGGSLNRLITRLRDHDMTVELLPETAFGKTIRVSWLTVESMNEGQNVAHPSR